MWTLVWTPDEISWFFDGTLLRTENRSTYIPGGLRSLPQQSWEHCRWDKMDLVLSTNFSDKNLSNHEELVVDYVKIYRPNSLSNYPGSGFNSYWQNQMIPAYNTTSYMNSNDWTLDNYKETLYNSDYQAKSDLRSVQEGGKFIYKGFNNLLWETYYNSGNYYSAPLSWSETVTGDIETARDGLSIFYRKYSTIKSYENGQFKSSIATNIYKNIVANENGLELYYIGIDRYIWRAYRSSLTSNNWTKVRLNTTKKASGGLVVHPNNFNVIYYRNNSNSISKLTNNYNNYWTHSYASNHYDATDDIAIDMNGKIYYRSTSNKLYYLYSSSTYRYNYNAYLNGTTFKHINNVKGELTVGNNPVEIYYKGNDDRIWLIKNGDYNYLDEFTKDIVGSIDLTDYTYSQDFVFIDNENVIRRFWFGSCDRQNPPCQAATEVTHKSNKPIKGENDIESIDQVEVNLNVVPNPAFDKIHLTLPLGLEELHLYSSDGQLMDIITMPSQNQKVDISHLNPGLYFLRAISSRNTHVVNFIKI